MIIWNSDWTKCHPAGCVSKHWTLFLLLLYGLSSCNFLYGWRLPTKQSPNWKWSKNKVWCKVSQPNIEWGLPSYYQIPHYLIGRYCFYLKTTLILPHPLTCPSPHISLGQKWQDVTFILKCLFFFSFWMFVIFSYVALLWPHMKVFVHPYYV